MTRAEKIHRLMCAYVCVCVCVRERVRKVVYTEGGKEAQKQVFLEGCFNFELCLLLLIYVSKRKQESCMYLNLL